MEITLYNFPYMDRDCTNTLHVDRDRQKREHFIKTYYCLRHWNIQNVFVVDKGHKDGIELHVLYKHGVVKIVNPLTRKIITYIFASPRQIIRYYTMSGCTKWDKTILEVARKNCVFGLGTL